MHDGDPKLEVQPTKPTKLCVYLASSSQNIENVRALAEFLEAKGITIAHRWWDDIAEAVGRGWSCDAELHDTYARRCAHADMAAIAACHVLVFLDSHHKSFGAALEIGYAIALKKPLYVLGNPHGRIWERLDEWRAVRNQVELVDVLLENTTKPGDE